MLIVGIRAFIDEVGFLEVLGDTNAYFFIGLLALGSAEYRLFPLLRQKPPMTPFGSIDTNRLSVVLPVSNVEQGVDYLVSRVPYLSRSVAYKTSEATLQLGEWSELNLMKFRIKIQHGDVVAFPVLSFWKGNAEGTLMFLHHLGQPVQQINA